MRLHPFRLQKPQLGRKLLRDCYSNPGHAPSMPGPYSQWWLWRTFRLGPGWSCCFSPIVWHLRRAGLGRAVFCCVRTRGGGWVVPMRGRSTIWLYIKQDESPASHAHHLNQHLVSSQYDIHVKDFFKLRNPWQNEAPLYLEETNCTHISLPVLRHRLFLPCNKELQPTPSTSRCEKPCCATSRAPAPFVL